MMSLSVPSSFSHSTRLLAATTLRNVLGTKNLAEILSERETISQVMQNALDEATDPWGVKVGLNSAATHTYFDIASQPSHSISHFREEG